MGKIKRAKQRSRDLEQRHEDLENRSNLELPIDEDKPGLGQYYCIECAKYLESERALATHKKGSKHRRQVKLLKEPPYTQKEAEFAAGIGSLEPLQDIIQARMERARGEDMPMKTG